VARSAYDSRSFSSGDILPFISKSLRYLIHSEYESLSNLAYSSTVVFVELIELMLKKMFSFMELSGSMKSGTLN
jgi:hypothetical protein